MSDKLKTLIEIQKTAEGLRGKAHKVNNEADAIRRRFLIGLVPGVTAEWSGKDKYGVGDAWGILDAAVTAAMPAIAQAAYDKLIAEANATDRDAERLERKLEALLAKVTP